MDSYENMQKPNIIFFMVDQLSAKWLENRCASVCPTPNFDKLRASGVTFTQAITNNPICCAARATLSTGLTSRGHGVLQNGYELDPDIPTFMRILQKQGWRTGAFGKVHLQAHFRSVYPDYKKYGFDVVFNTEDPRAGEWLDWVREEHLEYYEAALATLWSPEIPEYKMYGKDKIDISSKITEIRKNFKWATEKFPNGNFFMYTLPYPEEISQTEWITGKALEFISAVPPETPLYAHISYVQPHSPHCPPEKYMEMVQRDRIPAPIPPEWVEDPSHPSCFDGSEGATTAIPDYWLEMRHYYFADIAHLDYNLGRVMETLKKTGRYDNTYIFFISDHGELLLDHGFTGKGERHYDACIRIPMVITGPGVKSGVSHEELVQLEDIFPTVLDMCGLEVPELPMFTEVQDSVTLESSGHKKRKTMPDKSLSGNSLLPLCKGENVEGWRDAAYIESYNNINSFTPANWARTIRTREWRYTMYPENQGEQLFCLKDDLDEVNNLAYDIKYSGVRQKMRDKLMELIIIQDYPHTPRSLFALGVH